MRTALTESVFMGESAMPELPQRPGLFAALTQWSDRSVQLCWIERPPVVAIEHYLNEASQEGVLGRGWHREWSPQEPLSLDLLPLFRGRGALVRDMEELAALLCQVTRSSGARVRFDVITGVQCPRFHVDNVKARLLCTYRGQGSQWIEEKDADLSKLGEGAQGLPDEQSGLFLRPGAVQTLPPFAIALLKGRQWPGNEGRGAIHRSPPLARHAGPRVLVAIDAL